MASDLCVAGIVHSISTTQALDEPAKSCPVVMSSLSRSQAHPPAQRLSAYDNPQQPAAFPCPPSPPVVTEPTDTRPLTPTIHVFEQQPPPICVQFLHIQSAIQPNRPESLPGRAENYTLSQTMTPVLPPRSTSHGQIPSFGKKQRCTMGPRADCLKCRTGVKGHWMHFD